MPWYDELDSDKLNLGRAVGPYRIAPTSGHNIYTREFEKGYVFVNPTKADVATIRLPEPCKQFTHDNFQYDPATLADVSAIDLASHRGTMLLKATAAKQPNGVLRKREENRHANLETDDNDTPAGMRSSTVGAFPTDILGRAPSWPGGC